MNVGFKTLNKTVKKFLEGGAMPAEDPAMAGGAPEAGAPEEQGGGDPLMLIAQAAMQALQAQDCLMAMLVCEAFVQLVQQAQGGGAPAPEEQGEPVYRKGGTLVRRVRK